MFTTQNRTLMPLGLVALIAAGPAVAAGDGRAVATAVESRSAPEPNRNPMIHAEGTRIVTGEGSPVHLRGVILEGWLMWNGTLWGAGLTSETKLAQRLEKLIGPAELERFRSELYDTFITERDIEMIAELGLNTVRVPFNHTVLERGDAIDPTAPGWGHLDRLLDWCEAHSVYVILDLHAVPGGQSGVFVSDPDKTHVWNSNKDLQRTVDLWKAIASRYRDRTIVAGYDLVNEPEPPKAAALVDLYRRIIAAIRTVDPYHMVLLEGGAPAASDFSFYDGPLDANQAYSFHTYNLFGDSVDASHLEKLAKLAERQDVPLWNGEFGAHTAEWVRDQLDLFEDPAHHVNGWIFWPWKRVPEDGWARKRFRALMEIESSKDWDTVRQHLGSLFAMKTIPKELVIRALDEFIAASRADELIRDEPMVTILRSWQPRSPKAASAPGSRR